MDLDASLKSHGNRLTEIESFVAKVKEMIEGGGNAEKATDHLGELLAFKSEVEGVLSLIEKTVSDMSTVVADLDAIKKDLGPALAWIADQQKAAEELKAAQKSTDEAIAAKDAEPVEKTPAQITLDQINATTKPGTVA